MSHDEYMQFLKKAENDLREMTSTVSLFFVSAMIKMKPERRQKFLAALTDAQLNEIYTTALEGEHFEVCKFMKDEKDRRQNEETTFRE